MSVFKRRKMGMYYLVTAMCCTFIFQLVTCLLPCGITQIFLNYRTCLEDGNEGNAYLLRDRKSSSIRYEALKQSDPQNVVEQEPKMRSEESAPQNKTKPLGNIYKRNKSANEDMKIMLFWVSFFGHWDYEFGLGHEPFLVNNCPVSNCMTTQDRSLLDKASAVIFHMRNVGRDTIFPSPRFPNQTYVFFLQENPYHQWNDLSLFEGVFNLTMTYRQDSDVPVPYGVITETPSSRLTEGELKTLVAGKTHLVAWFVSNCGPTRSARETYVKELQKYISVDIYGKCGPLSCPEKNIGGQSPRMNADCYAMVERKYKFYLSFENTICKDYISEKVFNILEKYVVPVVFGGANYSEILPRNSVINILDFTSPRHLAEYLHVLAGNDVEYMQYFRWKMQYSAASQRRARGLGFCQLCEMLQDEKRPRKVHDNLNKWWDKKGSCDLGMPGKLRKTYDTVNV